MDESDRTQVKKLEIGNLYAGLAGKLENECDGSMDDLIARLDTVLTQMNHEKSVMTEIKSYYAQEKSLKKAYYLSLYS